MIRYACTLGLLALIGQAQAQDASGDQSSMAVNPAELKRITDLQRLSRTRPFISIFRVVAPGNFCEPGHCWPSAEFFVFNPDAKGEKDITVECAAQSSDGTIVAKAKETPTIPASGAGISSVTFEDSDFDLFRNVTCGVSRVVPH